MNIVHAVVIAILQGVTELFPVSSLGHAVILPKLLHWRLNEKGPTWLAFLVALHIGTATALLIYFRDEWKGVALAFWESVRQGEIGSDHDQRLAWMVLAGTVPAGLVGFLLQKPIRGLFASPYIAASFLVVNGAIMFAGERLLQRQIRAGALRPGRHSEDAYSRPTADQRGSPSLGTGPPGAAATANGVHAAGPLESGRYRDITQVSWRDAVIVGFAQVAALIPGISRSGVTMVAGLAAGLTHEAAARYAFLLATPIIGAAGLLELPDLFSPHGRHILGYALLGMVLAGVAAYVSVRYLMRYFETGRLYPFAYYCAGGGVLSLVLLSAGM